MSEYHYTILLTPEEGGYTVTVPALPAIATEGDTVEEAPPRMVVVDVAA